MPGMLFTLTGRDELSDVFDDIGDAARRLGRRVHAATMDADRDMRRFTRETSDRMAAMRQDTDAGAKSVEELGKVTKLLWPAVIPAAASLAPLAAGAGTVAVAAAAMTAALIPQVSALGDASEAQKAYEDAVDKSGARSQEAIAAQNEYQRVVSKLPPETRKAAVAVGILKDNYKAWSDSLAGDTMAPFVKGVALVDTLVPKTTGLVKAASHEADRFITIIGGEMASPGLDKLNSKFTGFAQKTLRSVTDELVHLLRVGDGGGGDVGGKAQEFMAWARAQGPTVASVLQSVATALLHVLQAGSDAGVGLLQVVDVLAHLVSAVPPEAIGMILQLALALKVAKAASLGMAAGRTALAQFGMQLVAMRTAAAATPGSLAAARAGIAALSRTAKAAIAGTGLGLLIIGLTELASRSDKAPPDVDKLTTSLRQLGAAGTVSGEASKVFGKNLSELHDKVAALTDPSTTDKVQQFLVGWTGYDSTPVKEAKQNIDAVDKALANLVSNGQGDLAAAALKRLSAQYSKGGRDASDFTSKLNDYKSAVADAKFEQELAAQSQGLFGAQALKTQQALASQKQSADGLRQSIQALNDVQRQGLDGMVGFEASIDAATKAAKDNAGALSMSHGQLDLNSEKARNAATALNDLASKTDSAAAQARESGASWSTVNGIYERGRAALLRSAEAMGLTKSQAKALADQILRTPDKTARLKGNIEDLEAKVTAAKKRLSSVPASRKASVRGDISNLEYEISRAQQRLRDIDGKTAVTYVLMKTRTSNAGSVFHEGGNYAAGGPIGFPGGGPISGPGTGTSDSIPIMASNGEYMINARSTAKYRSLVEAINSDTLGGGRGMPGAGAAVAQGLMSGMAGATSGVDSAARSMAAAVVTGIRAELQIASPSKKTKALAKDVGAGFIAGLTGSQDKIKSVSKDLAADIKTAFSGKKESSLLRLVDKDTKRLLDLAAKRDKVAATIAEAKKYASDVTSAAREGAGLSNLGMQPEEVTAGGIKGGLAGKLAQIKQFTKYVDILAKKGLNKGLLRQILNMGPEQGYAYASALVGADKGTFKSINSLQGQLDKSTTTLGQVGADGLYDAGKNAGKGFLKGLESQEKDLEKLMEKIAKSMQTALKRALGIRSPATKMIPHGINTARGVAVGVIRGLPHIDAAMQAVAGRVTGVVGGRAVAGRAAVAASAGATTVINLTIDVRPGGVADWEAVRRGLLSLKRHHGANVNLGLGA
jgi:hypothetical protein